MTDSLKQEAERRMRDALHMCPVEQMLPAAVAVAVEMVEEHASCPGCGTPQGGQHGVVCPLTETARKEGCWERVQEDGKNWVREVKAAVKAERERCAEIVELAAERIKHTSHRDGLGMGDQLTERRILEVADAIRNESKPPDNPGKTHFYGDGCDEEHGKPPCERCGESGITSVRIVDRHGPPFHQVPCPDCNPQEEKYECPIHGLSQTGDCPRC